jgi:ketosteroid isomerase-like protein
MVRSTEQVFLDHRDAILTGNFPKLIADYADDAVLMTMEGTFPGKEAVQGFFANLLSSQPNVAVSFGGYVVEGDMLLMEWSAESDLAKFSEGVDTFIIYDDKIQRQTMRFNYEPK